MEHDLFPDLPDKLYRILINVDNGKLPRTCGIFAREALDQVPHLHLVIEELEDLCGSTDGPVELLKDINGQADYYLNW